MSIGFWQIAVVVILVVLLFGRGKISSLMGDVAKGIKSFKKGMATDGDEDTPKNISENQDSTNQDSTNQDSTNQDSTNQDSTNQDSTNQDSNNKE